MNHKVLLADDSLTIQKVINITLANQPYDITEASSEEELFQQLPIVQPKLVFLDFNLSEKYTGYELTSKIKSLSPSTKVLLLLGTFDTIDEAAMEKCGASDKIVKPFDSNKFIAICKQLIETFADEELVYPEPKAEAEPHLANPEDHWTVSHSTEQTFKEPEKPLDSSFPNMHNPLQKEVSDWGMSVPGVINDKNPQDMMIGIPPVIGEVKSLDDLKAAKFPANEDLDYPTIEQLESSKEAPVSAPTSKLISIDSFNDKAELEIESSYMPDESDVKKIEAQIRDEVEEDLWHADEFEDLKNEVSAKMEEAKKLFQPTEKDFDESLFKPIDDSESITWTDSNDLELKTVKHEEPAFKVPSPDFQMEDVRKEMEEMVKKYVKEYLDDLFHKEAEKVAWEVIPDLAENLIRQELSKISNKILND